MYHTTNETTVRICNATATVIADSIHNGAQYREGRRLITVELVYPRVIHAEVARHRVFSNTVSSHRATPTRVVIADATYTPAHWTRNKAGMVGEATLTEDEVREAERVWNTARSAATGYAQALADLGLHKQHVNRILEPYAFVRHLITATEWENFFNLRLAPDADPEIQDLAQAIKQSFALSIPCERLCHIPYVDLDTVDKLGYDKAMQISAARCARVSYLKHDQTAPTVEEDLKLYDRLAASGHWSPMEHQAVATAPDLPHANFWGWQSFRRMLGH